MSTVCERRRLSAALFLSELRVSWEAQVFLESRGGTSQLFVILPPNLGQFFQFLRDERSPDHWGSKGGGGLRVQWRMNGHRTQWSTRGRRDVATLRTTRPSIHSDRVISKQKVWFQERMIQKTSYSLHFSGSQHLRTTSVAAFVKDSLVNRNWL